MKASYSCWGGFPNSPRRVPSHSTQTWGSPSSDSGSGFLISKASVTLQCSQRNILPLIKARWERVGAKKGFFSLLVFAKEEGVVGDSPRGQRFPGEPSPVSAPPGQQPGCVDPCTKGR